MKILTKNGYIDAVALFFELTDAQLKEIENNKNYYLDKDKLDEYNDSRGDNAHFFGITNSTEHLNIHDYISDLLQDYKSVSWWDRDIEKFKEIRR